MKALLLLTVTLFFMNAVSATQYATPGTGVKYTLDDLVTHSGGLVTFSSGEYSFSDTVLVSPGDTLSITSDAMVKFSANGYLRVRENGVLLIDPPNNVTFTAQNTTDGFKGLRLDTSNASILRKLTYEYAITLRISDCSPRLDSCMIRYNFIGSSTSGDGAISLFRASPLITNCSFIQNRLAAIQGGANIANAPKIYNCYFFANVTNNANRPQINLGATSASGQDTTKIIGNTIIGGSVMSGGIGFLPVGNVYAVVNGNVIRKNRYGITFNGGANINAVISYNVIDTNNIQNDPALGGSGIAFTGGSSTSQQNTIVTGNIIRANLWGVTIQNRARPNLGDLSNADTTDNGKNSFINNTNASTPFIDLYNNSIDNIKAENNYWNTDDPLVAEDRIFHQADNAALGLVDFDPIMTAAALPVTLTRFDAVLQHNSVKLSWQTATEENTSHFNIQGSVDGRAFVTMGREYAAGNSITATNYQYMDDIGNRKTGAIYYRLQIVDLDGKISYSTIKKLALHNGIGYSIAPNPATKHFSVTGEGKVNIRIISFTGQVLQNRTLMLPASNVDISALPKGVYTVQISDAKGTVVNERLIKQ